MMKALDIRCEFAINKIGLLSQPESYELQSKLKEILQNTVLFGEIDRHKHNPICPIYFEDEPLLSEHWQSGINGSRSLERIIFEIDRQDNIGCPAYQRYNDRRQWIVENLLTSSSEFKPKYIELMRADYKTSGRIIEEAEIFGTAYSNAPINYQGICRVIVDGRRSQYLVFPNEGEASQAARWAIGDLGGYDRATIFPAEPNEPITHQTAEEWFFD